MDTSDALDEDEARIADLEGENERLRAALEQIKTVCDDNAGAEVRHDLALKFVREIAATAIEQ
jgi:hypothetical protein